MASVYPEVKWLHEHGINADVIVSYKLKKDLIMEKEFRTISTSLYISTDDGSYGYKGCSIDLLKELVEKERKKYDYVIGMASIDQQEKEEGHVCHVGLEHHK